MYLGAEHLIGFLTVRPSAQWYSYFGPADMIGQLSSVQNSVMVPYSMFIWLKKSTAGTKKCLWYKHELMQSRSLPQTLLFEIYVISCCITNYVHFQANVTTEMYN